MRFISFQDQIHKKQTSKSVNIICPKCNTVQELQIPKRIINQSKQLTTVSIPSKLICEHSFQVFIDKDFHVRGYQKVDFEFSTLEFYEDNPSDIDKIKDHSEDYIINYNLSKLIKFLIQALRRITKNTKIIGTGLFFEKGKVVYSSLPEDILLKAMDEIEFRYDLKLQKFKKTFLVMDDYRKLLSTILQLEGHTLIIYLLFPSDCSFQAGDRILRKILNKALELYLQLIHFKGKKGKYWIYSSLHPQEVLNHSEKVNLAPLDIEISKAKILNLEEIKLISQYCEFEGKIYISEEYVELMRGLSLTLNSAKTILESLNKSLK